jgi:hypothetical protein
MNAGESAILRGGGWWSGHGPGGQSVARSSCDMTSMPATSWGGFSWQVLYSGSAAEHGLSVIEIVSKWSAAASIMLGGTDADCVSMERSAILPRIQPACGQRTDADGLLPVYSAIPRSLALASSLRNSAPDLVRSLVGKRTAMDDRIVRPVGRTC